MRFRKKRLAAPASALNANSRENCHGRDEPLSRPAETRKATKHPKFIVAASRTKYLPLKSGGTSSVIQGSQAQLEMPRDRLKQNNSAITNASWLLASRNPPAKGTSATP